MEKVVLNLKVTKEQRHALDMTATERSKTMAHIIREAIAEKLREIAPERASSWDCMKTELGGSKQTPEAVAA
jgi:hypothetical protein